jgi:hypothetical protein
MLKDKCQNFIMHFRSFSLISLFKKNKIRFMRSSCYVCMFAYSPLSIFKCLSQSWPIYIYIYMALENLSMECFINPSPQPVSLCVSIPLIERRQFCNHVLVTLNNSWAVYGGNTQIIYTLRSWKRVQLSKSIHISAIEIKSSPAE